MHFAIHEACYASIHCGGWGDAPLSLMVFRVDPVSTDRIEAPGTVRLALTYSNVEGTQGMEYSTSLLNIMVRSNS